MSLNDQQISLIQSSFEQIKPNADLVAARFYENLFEIAPELRALFKGDIKIQGGKLMTTLAVAIASLRNIEQVVPTLQQLGRQHHALGVREAHYAPVGEALLATLSEGLGKQFDEPLRLAWATMYATVAEVMIEAASDRDEDAA